MEQVIIIRLKPGDDLKEEIEKLAKEKNIEAGWVVTCVGSLTRYSIRFANQSAAHIEEGFFEIVSLTGTISVNSCHLHIAIADQDGRMVGGHLLTGNIIYTTAEIVISASDKFFFTRENDGTTNWKELQIQKRSQ